MDILERVLHEKSSELVRTLTVDAGMSPRQAERFLREAGPALIDSYRWQADELEPEGLGSPTAVRDLLSGISGRALAPKVGLSSERTWDGLRALVPAVVRSGAKRRQTPQGTQPGARREDPPDTATRFDVGFGLSLEAEQVKGSGGGNGHGRTGSSALDHPLFRYLMPRPGTSPS